MAKKAAAKKAPPKAAPKAAPKGATPAPKGESKLVPLKAIPPDNEAEEKLRQLLTDLDDIGVAIDETEYRPLSDGAKRMTEKWVAERLQNILTPVPFHLMKWSTQELKNEYAPYAEEQEEARKQGFQAEFGKPSVGKAVDDQTAGMITMVCVIPIGAMTGNMADALFVHKRLKIEFSRRQLNDWKQKTIDNDGNKRIICCEADVSGHHTSRHNRKFKFLVSKDLIGTDEAFEVFWGSKGACRVEVLGEPVVIAKAEGDEDPKPKGGSKGKKSSPAAGPGPTLFDKDRDKPIGETETIVLVNTDLFSVETGLFQTKAGWLTTCDITSAEGFSSITKETLDNMAPRPNQEQALEARLGRIIDFWAALPVPKQAGEKKEHNLVLTGLKDWLTRLDKGEKIDTIQMQPKEWVNMSKGGGS